MDCYQWILSSGINGEFGVEYAYRIKTAEGEITVYEPQVRDIEEPFKLKLARFFKKNTEVLEKLALEMYVRGLSTRDIEDVLRLSKYPSLVMCLKDDLEASLNHLRLPVRHRKSLRTTNLVERSFEEERRRSKVIPRFLTEKAALKLVFAVLVRASRRWQRVKFTEKDLEYLDKLRKKLGLEVRDGEVVGV